MGLWANLACIIIIILHVSICIGACKQKEARPSRGPVLVWVPRAVQIPAESGGPARCGFIAYLIHGVHRAARQWFIRSYSIRALHILVDPDTLRDILGAPIEFELVFFFLSLGQ